MTRQRGRRCFGLGLFSVFAILLFSGAWARSQTLYHYDWALRFNNSIPTETEDNWVATSYVAGVGGTPLVAVSLPIGANFTDQPISAMIYQGYDLADPTALGGLTLLSKTDRTITT